MYVGEEMISYTVSTKTLKEHIVRTLPSEKDNWRRVSTNCVDSISPDKKERCLSLADKE